MMFPEMIGGFRRVSIDHYDPQGRDVSAGYDSEVAGRLAALTVYVYSTYATLYPESDGFVSTQSIADLITAEFQQRKREIETKPEYSNVVRVAERRLDMNATDTTLSGWHADYKYETSFAGRRQKVVSELEVFCDASTRWCLEYRLTQPANATDVIGLATIRPLLPVTVHFRPKRNRLF